MGREVTQLDLGLWSGSTLPSLRSGNGRRRARRARGGRSLLPVAGLPGFRGDLPEWSYQQVISRERNARPSRRRSNSFATARQHPSSIVGRAGNCALALPHQQSDVCDVEDGGEDARPRMNGSLPEDERWSDCAEPLLVLNRPDTSSLGTIVVAPLRASILDTIRSFV